MTDSVSLAALRHAVRQAQFLDVADLDEAHDRLRRHLRAEPLGTETLPLRLGRSRVLAQDVPAPVDVPGFDRAGVDGNGSLV